MKHNQTLRRGLGVLLSLVLCLSLLPAAALAADPATKTADFIVDANAALALLNAAKTGTADSTWADNTLTLKGVNFSTTASTAVKLPTGAKIVLAEGTTNTIASMCAGEASGSEGIYAEDGLTIQGSGTLTVTGGTATNYSAGIFATYVTIKGGNVTAAGGSGQYYSYGIFGLRKVTISDNANVTATGGEAKTSYGIRVPGQGEGYGVNIQGGTVTATGDEAFEYSYGISSENDVTISNNAKVTATGGKTNLSYGISSENDVTISGNAEVTATGGEATVRSYGILANKGDVLIKGGTVTATGDKTDNDSYGYSYGIYNHGDFTIENGEVNVTAGTAGSNSFGIYVYGGDFTIKNGEVNVTASTADKHSYGIYVYGGDFTIENGEVNVTAGEANQYSYGICADKYVVGSSWISGKIIISGGHVTAQTLAGDTAQKKSALYIDRDGELGLSDVYQWRTSLDDGFTSSDETAYEYNAGHTYVEFCNGKTKTYTVTFDPNDGSGATKAVTVVSGSFTLPVCTFTAPSGKQFKAWSVNGTEYAVGAIITVSANTTVTAVWEEIPVTTYTVTFDPNGGDLTGWTTTETEPDGTVDYLPRAAREGYTFDGWYTAADGGDKVYTYVTVFTADTTVYAHWTPEADTKQITEAVFGLKGYAVGEDAEDIVITSYTEGLSLTAGYFEALGKPYSYLIAVVSGDDYAPITGALEAGKEYVLMLKADVNAGYDGSGLTKDNITLNSTIPAADCAENKEESTLGILFVLPVLTADDTADAAYTVTVNGSYASATGAGEYEAGDLVTLAAGTRSSYTFSGWTSDDITIPNAGSADTSFVMPAKAVTVTANWIAIGGGSGVSTYAITVASAKNGAVTASSKSAAKGAEVTLTVTPDKGYTLETLTVTDASGKEVTLTEKGGKYTFTMPASNVTVKATFMEDNSMLNFFVDVPADAYYYDAVMWAAEKGITGGVDDTHFAPNAPCTRAQIVTFLWRAAGSPEPENASSFADVSADSYYAKAVAWAVENGITTGTGDGMFSPNAPCTRAQAMTFLWRSQKSVAADGVNPFTDVAADAYYADAVLWAVANGITDGTSATTFSPASDCTRAQIVTFLFRCLGEE